MVSGNVALRKRLEEAEANVRRLCWISPEGYNDLYCDLCAATAEDGKGQEYLDTQHLPGCRAALAGEKVCSLHGVGNCIMEPPPEVGEVLRNGPAWSPPIANPDFDTDVGGADVFKSWAEETGAVGVEATWRPVRFNQSMTCPLCRETFEIVVTANVRGAAWMDDLSAVVPALTGEEKPNE